MIEVRGLFATSSVTLLDLLDVILQILRYDLIEVRGEKIHFLHIFVCFAVLMILLVRIAIVMSCYLETQADN